jgi:hypothetical protein
LWGVAAGVVGVEVEVEEGAGVGGGDGEGDGEGDGVGTEVEEAEAEDVAAAASARHRCTRLSVSSFSKFISVSTSTALGCVCSSLTSAEPVFFVILCFHSDGFIGVGFLSSVSPPPFEPSAASFLFLNAPSKLCDGGMICILGCLDLREEEEAEEEEEEEEEEDFEGSLNI